jgi:hypothetical protein
VRLAPMTLVRDMHPRTIATLKRLEEAHWFSRVGVKDTQVARVLSSWDEAIEHCSSIDWENLTLEAVNQYCERLFARSRERFSTWNEVGERVRRPALDLVDGKIEAVVREHNLPVSLGNAWQTISLAFAWRPNSLTCVRRPSSRLSHTGTPTVTFHVDGRAGFRRKGSSSSTDYRVVDERPRAHGSMIAALD